MRVVWKDCASMRVGEDEVDSRDGRWMRDYGVKRGSGGHAASISMMKAGSRRAFCSRPRVAICCLRWCPRSL